MAKKKPPKRPAIELVATPEELKYRTQLDQQASDQLKEMIRELNAGLQRKAEAKRAPHTEHDPDLPPAA